MSALHVVPCYRPSVASLPFQCSLVNISSVCTVKNSLQDPVYHQPSDTHPAPQVGTILPTPVATRAPRARRAKRASPNVSPSTTTPEYMGRGRFWMYVYIPTTHSRRYICYLLFANKPTYFMPAAALPTPAATQAPHVRRTRGTSPNVAPYPKTPGHIDTCTIVVICSYTHPTLPHDLLFTNELSCFMPAAALLTPVATQAPHTRGSRRTSPNLGTSTTTPECMGAGSVVICSYTQPKRYIIYFII